MSGLYAPIQSISAVEQDRGCRESGSSVAVISKSPLLRRSIERGLGLLGVTVFGYGHFDSMFQGSGRLQPDVVLIDTAGQELPWEALVSLVKVFSVQSRIVLLAASMNVVQTVEAVERGVAAILIKPYRAEGHTARILDLLLQSRGIQPKRLQPRFTVDNGTQLRVDYLPMNDWPAFPMGVSNISGKGAQLCLPYGEYAGELQPGRSGFPATLAVTMARISLNLQVVYREGGSIGVEFDGLGSGGRVLNAFIEDMRNQIAEGGANRRRW